MSSVQGVLARRSPGKQQRSAALYFDVGSSMVRVVQNGEVIYREPSCVALHVPSDQVVAVGTKAYQLLGKTSKQVELIFPIQDGSIAHRVAFEHLMQAVLLECSPQFSFWNFVLGNTGNYATLSTLTPQERVVLNDSLRQIGLGRVKLANQILSAAEYLRLLERAGQSYCLVDIGGQISEVAVVTGDSVSAATRLKLGGIHCTERIQEAILQKYECAVSWQTAEVIKRQLGLVSADDSYKRHKVSIRGKQLLTQLGATVVVSNEDIVPVCTNFAEEIFKSIQQLFSQAPTEVVTSCLEQGIFLLGGGALLKGLPEFLQSRLHTEVSISPEPELVVVRGLAGIHL